MPSISGRITETGLGGITLGTRSWGMFSFGRGGDARWYREIYLVTEVEGWCHAARLPGLPCRVGGGSSVSQMSVAYRQRGWERQPDGGAIGFGTSPSGTICCLLADRSGSGIGTSGMGVQMM